MSDHTIMIILVPLRFGLRPQGPCRVGTGESGLVLSEEGNPAGLSSCSGDPMDCSTPGLPVYHQLLEFTQTHVHRVGDAISSSVVLSSSCPQSLPAYRQEYWSGLPYSPPGDLPNPEIKPRSPTLQVDSLPSEPPRKPKNTRVGSLSLFQQIFRTQESN